jgi:hypothetical protein
MIEIYFKTLTCQERLCLTEYIEEITDYNSNTVQLLNFNPVKMMYFMFVIDFLKFAKIN